MSPMTNLSRLRRLFSAVSDRPRPRRVPSSRLERLEDRTVPAAVAGLVAGAAAGATTPPVHVVAQTQSLGSKMAKLLEAKVGTRVGGGECAQMATEAMRASGADFTRTEPAGTQNYVWTTNRVARLTQGSQATGQKFQVGDIIQFDNATFRSGNSTRILQHHTQVVAAVDSNGRITKVYEQNVNGNLTVQKDAAIDLKTLASGTVSVYRPVARVAQAGTMEFTVVNNTNSTRSFNVQVGNWTGTHTLTKANTAGSYETASVSFSGSVKPMIKIGGVSVQIQDGAAYELYTKSDGQVGIRKI